MAGSLSNAPNPQEKMVSSPDAPAPEPAPASPPTSRKRERSRGRRIVRGLGFGALVLALIVGIGGAAAYWKFNHNIESKALDEADHVVKDDTPKGALNVLFIGSDSRKLKTKGYGKEEGQRSDALMLVHFSKNNTRIDAVQIPRDTLTDLPACDDTGSGAFAGGPQQMINSALAGGPACSVRAVEQLSGVHINHFVQLDFDGFASMVNALGGVKVCLNQAMVDPDAKLNLPAGKQKLKGKDALALARTRHAVGDGSDIGRLGHQQVVMSSIISQARSAGTLTRPDRLFKFINALTSSITVDDGISSIPKLTSLAQRARSVDDSDIRFITMPNGTAPTDPNRVVKTADADTIFAAIAKDKKVPVEGSEDEKKASRETPVKLLNAAQTNGLATAAQASMSTLGYTISGIENAQKPAKTTRIFVDGTPEAMATADAINRDFGFMADVVVHSSGMTGVWLILGADRIEGGVQPKAPKAVKATTRTASDSLCA
ncbi:transcriptional regulator [Aeromicrobium yanjiei]|uniref:Transcriptional regulator n=1 Tax=Aeromicrobium yanjiei TaxID=2662028 RepID=A0A5Q2MEY9_9ACTN|nr:transcriptional regulator [Aeromicrobium yanjiei]